ncbi:MAG: hypothetical protein KY443_02965 [Actinobacteria bacterium]|nr:hypothetical protein [Actinomycetota bacterium]
MRLRTHRQVWGAVGPAGRFPTMEEFVPAVAARGYDAIEVPLLLFEWVPDAVGGTTRARFEELAEIHGLDIVPLVPTFGSDAAEHFASFRTGIADAVAVGAQFAVAHAGSDAFDAEEAVRYLADCVAVAEDAGLVVAHETHRGRALWNPWRTASLLERLDGLWLTADLSHYVCVAERLLRDQHGVLDAICARALHAHQRVGYENGPQVPDPRDERWAAQVAAHEAWWDAIWRAAERRGDEYVRLTPEYGPPTYAPVDTDAATLWDICEWATDRARQRFAAGPWRASPSAP